MRQKVWLALFVAAGAAVVAVGATSARAAISDGLVVHLRFDGNIDDSSPRNNDGTFGGTGLFYLPGANSDNVTRDPLIGSGALDLSYAEADEFVIFPNTVTDLQFGTATDFSVAFWAQRIVNPLRTTIGDPSFIGNKDWGAGGNPGWVIAADEGVWQWNYADASGTRRDFDSGGDLADGDWHHIAVTHDRDGLANFYHDGVLLGSANIAGLGDINTQGINSPRDGQPLTTNIGQDGTRDYHDGNATPRLTHNMDDLGVWRRVLNAGEILTIAALGRNGEAISDITPDEELVPGDIDDDGDTDRDDYLIWNANVGYDNGLGRGDFESLAKGDADFNGVVDLGDFRIIADFAHPPLSVPEPASIALVLCSLVGIGFARARFLR